MSILSHTSERDGVTPSQDLSQLDPQALEYRLGDLIRRYVRGRSAVLAHSVVSHIEALIRHPQVRDPALFCAYRRLATHWRWLAAEHNGTAVRTNGLTNSDVTGIMIKASGAHP